MNYFVHYVVGSYVTMMAGWMMLRRVVAEIKPFVFDVYAFPPVDVELFLSLTTAQPVKSHVHTFGLLGFTLVFHQGCSNFVVKLDWYWKLFVA